MISKREAIKISHNCTLFVKTLTKNTDAHLRLWKKLWGKHSQNEQVQQRVTCEWLCNPDWQGALIAKSVVCFHKVPWIHLHETVKSRSPYLEPNSKEKLCHIPKEMVSNVNDKSEHVHFQRRRTSSECYCIPHFGMAGYYEAEMCYLLYHQETNIQHRR